jgi:hypothetical protein
VLIPIIKETELSWMLWPVVFAVDGLAIALAVITMSLTPILFVFLLSGLVAASWIMDMPASTSELPQMLIVIVAFAVFFMAAALLAGRKVLATVGCDRGNRATPKRSRTWVALERDCFRSCCWHSVSVRLRLADPTPVFAVARLLAVLMLGMVRVFKADALAAAPDLGAGCRVSRGTACSSPWRKPTSRWRGTQALPCCSSCFHFCSSAIWSGARLPWVVAALSLPLHFLLIYRGVLMQIRVLPTKG